MPLGPGSLRLLAVGFSSSVSTATVADSNEVPPPPRNELGWTSHSYGASWEGGTGSWRTSSGVWHAFTSSDVDWHADTVRYTLESELSESGGRVGLSRSDSAGEWTFSGRIHVRRTVFARRDEPPAGALDHRSRATVLSAFAARRHRLGRRSEVSLGSTISRYDDRVFAGPFADVRVNPGDWITISVGGVRRYQFMQSLRNPETIVSNIFPADLYVNAGASVPVARSDQGTLAVQLRPSVARALTVRVWSRSLSGLALPAVGGDELAARSAIVTGTGRARGVSIDASLAWARAGAIGSYALQRVRYEAADTAWTPESGVTHAVDAGVRLFPSPTFSISVALAAVAGRRATPYAGAFEWEACNLRDRGCEFAGGSLRRDGALGGLTLPGYVRIDAGLRKHWHVGVGGRDVALGTYATWTNLLSRSNVLTVLRDPEAGGRSVVAMRPGSPLVIGFDWTF
jgi:hypothetical protein